MADVKMTDEYGNPTWTGVLQAFEDGQVDIDAATLWRELILAVGRFGKAGTLTITVKVSPDKEDPQVLGIEASASSKPPTRPAEPEVWVADRTGYANRSALPGMSKTEMHGGTIDMLGSSLQEGDSLTISSPGSDASTTIKREDGKLRAV